MSYNPNCDFAGAYNVDPCSPNPEVRVLPTGGGGNIICCANHYRHELRYGRERNRELSAEAQYDLPDWQTLKVYDGS